MQKIWHYFWFKPVDVRQFAILRISFGLLSTVYLLQLLPFIDTHFSGNSWLANVQLPKLLNWGTWSIFNVQLGSYSAFYSHAVLILGIGAAIAMMVGWKTRWSTFITWLVLASLWNRNPLLLDGDDAVLKVMAFYLLLTPCGGAWSIDAQHHKLPTEAAVWPLRLIQFQIALIYFVSGWVKFHSAEWLDGSVLQYVLSHPHYSRFDWSGYFKSAWFVGMLSVLASIIRWWELLFPFLLLNSYLRRLSLVLGVMFHIGLLVTMNLRWFPIIMLALYPALLSSHDFRRFLQLSIVKNNVNVLQKLISKRL